MHVTRRNAPDFMVASAYVPTEWEIDAELLHRWRGGDSEAGDQILTRHGDAVIRFFRNKVCDGAEDLVQQTFLRLLEGRNRIKDGVALRGYVLGIARNVLREHIRRLAPERELDPEDDSMASLAPGPSTIAGRRREHRLLLEALRQLPVDDQIALELFYWEGLKANHIAEVMGVSHSAMRSRLAKARSLLVERIRKLDESAQLIESTVRGLDEWASEIRAQVSGTVKLPNPS